MLEDNQIKVKSVKKTIDILDCFLTDENLGVSEIANKLNMSKSNVSDILTTLVALDYLGKDPDSEKYYLSVGSIRLARCVGKRYSFRNIARPYIQDLANRENADVSLTVPLNGKIFYLDQVHPTKSVPYAPKKLGSYTCRMHCTAAGKCMLANMKRTDVLRYLASGLEKYTDNTITDDSKFLEMVAETKKNGYATDDFEWSEDFGCVGVPLYDAAGNLIGAISINLKDKIRDAEIVERTKNDLIETSDRITAILAETD